MAWRITAYVQFWIIVCFVFWCLVTQIKIKIEFTSKSKPSFIKQLCHPLTIVFAVLHQSLSRSEYGDLYTIKISASSQKAKLDFSLGKSNPNFIIQDCSSVKKQYNCKTNSGWRLSQLRHPTFKIKESNTSYKSLVLCSLTSLSTKCTNVTNLFKVPSVFCQCQRLLLAT